MQDTIACTGTNVHTYIMKLRKKFRCSIRKILSPFNCCYNVNSNLSTLTKNAALESSEVANKTLITKAVLEGKKTSNIAEMTKEEETLSTTPNSLKDIFKGTHTIERMVIMSNYARAILGLPPCTDEQLEKLALLIYDSMEAPSRTFHNVEHLRDLSVSAVDTIQQSAIAFHDLIYYQIDGGLSDAQREYLHDIVVEKEDTTNEITTLKLEAAMEMVMDIFGFTYGQVLNPYKGMNEFLSACVCVRSNLEMDRKRSPVRKMMSLTAKCAACIEATIPFRTSDENGRYPPEALFERLKKVNVTYDLQWDEEETVKAVQRSVDLGNRDLDNFSWKDRGKFLTNTWKLLPESNVALRTSVYYLSDLSLAMKKMAGFFEFLDPETLYFSFRDAKMEAMNKIKTTQARKNINTALHYMRHKLVALSVLSAIAELSGGDVPISLFVGDFATEGRPMSSHIEDFLDTDYLPSDDVDIDHAVLKLLREGRAKDSFFDSNKSYLAALIYAHIGQRGMEECLKYIVHPMDEAHSWLLLRNLPISLSHEILSACSNLAITRRLEISEIVDKLRDE